MSACGLNEPARGHSFRPSRTSIARSSCTPDPITVERRPLMNNGTGSAEFACVACRRLKRKCNKALPSCSLCTRVGRTCEYQDPSSALNEYESPARRPRIHTRKSGRTTHLLSQVGTPSSDVSDASARPGRWFLDSVASRGSQMSLNRFLQWTDVISHPLPPSMVEARAILDHYISTSHQWWPIL